MTNSISKKYITDYITKELGHEMRHDVGSMVYSIRSTAKEYSLNRKALFHYIVERASTITGTQSYGFDTHFGRELRGTFEHNYNIHYNNNN